MKIDITFMDYGLIQKYWNENNSHYRLKQGLVALGPLLLTVSLGMTTGFSAILLPQLQQNTSAIQINDKQASWIASMAALPMALGCIIGGLVMEKSGRKFAHLIACLPCMIGWLQISYASSIPTLISGRFLTGLGGGVLGASTSVYIGETVEPTLRGILLGAISFSVALGLLIVHLLGTFYHWRTIALIGALLTILALFCLLLVPESPAWLVNRGRCQRAEVNFYWLRGVSDANKNEFSKISATNIPGKINKSFLKPFIIIVVFIVANQWSGINALTFYTVATMKKLLGNNLNEYVAMLIVDVIRVIMSIMACFAMKKIGRRPLAIISGTGTCVALFTLCTYLFLAPNSNNVIIPMTSLVLYISFITIGFVPLPWAMMGEVFPLEQRNIGSGFCSFIGFLAFFSVVQTFPDMLHNFGTIYTFLIYGFVAFLGTIFVYICLPETKDKPLYKIEENFKGNNKT